MPGYGTTQNASRESSVTLAGQSPSSIDAAFSRLLLSSLDRDGQCVMVSP
jgi:hypothetical protein